jgi:hypothetical protein
MSSLGLCKFSATALTLLHQPVLISSFQIDPGSLTRGQMTDDGKKTDPEHSGKGDDGRWTAGVWR